MSKNVSLEELLKSSDIVALEITADEENRNFMDKAKFDLMKRGSWFLNISREWLVNQTDLQAALENRLTGAWSDFPEHQGGKTIESLIATEKFMANKLKTWLGQDR